MANPSIPTTKVTVHNGELICGDCKGQCGAVLMPLTKRWETQVAEGCDKPDVCAGRIVELARATHERAMKEPFDPSPSKTEG